MLTMPMLNKPILVALILVVSVLSLPTQQVDTENSKISFVFKEKDVEGTIGEIRSESSIDLEDFTQSTLKGSVSLESLKTGNFLRDWHLMSKKFFHRSKQDRLYFESTEILLQNEVYVIKGNLNIKGISKPVSFEASLENKLLQLNGAINVADWGIIIVKDSAKNVVEISMSFPITDS